MRLPLGALAIGVSVALLSGCVASTAPAPTPSLSPSSTAEPTTLDELAQAAVSEGLARSVVLSLTGGRSGALQIQLFWDEAPSPAEQLEALASVEARIGTVLPDRPETTQIALVTTLDDGKATGVTTAYDPGDDVLLEMLEITSGTLCSGVAGLQREDLGDGPKQIVDLNCSVNAADAAGLAAAYDEITANRVKAEGFETHWNATITDRPSTDASMRLDVGPIAGRQQQLVDVMKLATGEGADHFTVIDGGSGIAIIGFADAAQAQLCTTMRDRLVAAGVAQSSVSLQLRDTTPGGWACQVRS